MISLLKAAVFAMLLTLVGCMTAWQDMTSEQKTAYCDRVETGMDENCSVTCSAPMVGDDQMCRLACNQRVRTYKEDWTRCAG
jgi:hypothetical protein|tara:strand:- start:1817 stop:2062 length:246 start_codon:yes stop_codon:yes gene_type:complete